jgi:soluble lytic murein transglycosylase
LRRGGAPFATTCGFLERNPDWPGLPYLRAQGEPSLPRGGDPSASSPISANQAPRTGLGALALGECAYGAGQRGGARAIVVAAWTGLTMSGDAAAALRSGYQSL